jgi:hypothetical protein
VPNGPGNHTSHKWVLGASLSAFLAWIGYISVGQVLDNQARAEGPRWTEAKAQMQAKAYISEILLILHQTVDDHASTPGHAAMDQRVVALERLFDQTAAVEAEETEILRDIRDDIRRHVRNVEDQIRRNQSPTGASP